MSVGLGLLLQAVTRILGEPARAAFRSLARRVANGSPVNGPTLNQAEEIDGCEPTSTNAARRTNVHSLLGRFANLGAGAEVIDHCCITFGFFNMVWSCAPSS